MFETTLGKMLQPQPVSDAEAEVPYIKSLHVQWQGVSFNDLPSMWASPIDIQQLELDIGDLMVCEGGEVGRCAMVSTSPPHGCIFQNALHRVRGREKNDVRYLGYCLKQAAEAGWFDVLCNRATIAHFTVEKLRELRIHLPCAETQRLIANYLDRETACIDKLIAEKERMLALLDEKRSALISRVVTRGLDPNAPLKSSGLEWLGEIPAHWTIERAKNLFAVRDERSDDGLEELLTVSHITGVTSRSEKNVYMFEADDKAGYKRCLPGDLAVNTLWAWMGAMGISPLEGIVSPDYHVYTSKGELLPEYIDLLCRSKPFVAEVIRWSKGVWSSRLRLYPENFFEMRLPVPPKSEQLEICRAVEADQRKANNLRDSLHLSITLAKERRSALIAAAVTGQIPLEDMDE
ncbi:restriction endonuclease subunit S [Cyanobium sp. FGCU-52]|nr:restriction endonuclease subunit S [Cyanobium sp. FGCU52]